MKLILNGNLVTKDEAVIPADSRAVAYGDGCFDTLRSYQGKFLMLDRHLERLHGAMNYLGMDASAFPGEEAFREQVAGLLEANGFEDGQAVVRTQVWREGGRGYHIREPSPVSWMIQATPMPEMPTSVDLTRVETRRIPSRCLNPRYKLSNGINYIVARRVASQQGADDALMLTTDDYLSETTIANLFWHRDGVVFTSSEDCDLLPGITRGILMGLVENIENLKLETGKFRFDELKKANAAWICNSLREIVPVRRVDDIFFNVDHPLVKSLQHRFELYRDKHLV